MGCLHPIERLDVGGVVFDMPGFQPRLEAFLEIGVIEVLAPQRAEFYACLGERSVEVEHADESRPSAAPIGKCEDGSLVGEEAGQEVVAVLPDGFGDDERRVCWNVTEDLHAVFLAIDETVFLGGVHGMGALDFAAERFHGRKDLRLHRGLRGLTFLVGGEAKVTVGDKMDGFHVKMV